MNVLPSRATMGGPEPSSVGARWGRRLLSALSPEWAPLDLQILGRVLLHSVLVGLAAGLVGAAFFAGL
jgi:hypothetical protein